MDLLLEYEDSGRAVTTYAENASDYTNLTTSGTTTMEHAAGPTDPGPNPRTVLLFLFIFYTVCMGPVCLMGIAGNTISILVLDKDRNNRVVTFLLKCLAVADNLVLMVSFVSLSLIYGLLHYVEGRTAVNAIKPYIIKYVQPVGYISQTLTIWLTVLLAVNRYIAICRPFDVHRFCTLRTAKIQVLVCLVVTALLNVPRFFQYNIVTVTQNNTTRLKVEPSPTIGEPTLFGMIVTNGLFTVLVLVLPLILLLVVNTKLIRELRRMQRRMNHAAKQFSSDAHSEQNITIVMVIIIVVLLLCHTPDRVAQLLRVTVPTEDKKYPKFTFIFINIANFLIVLNSSTNFFIYYFLRQRFRQIFKAAFGCKPKQMYSEDDRALSVLQSTPLTEQPNLNKITENSDASTKMIPNGKTV